MPLLQDAPQQLNTPYYNPYAMGAGNGTSLTPGMGYRPKDYGFEEYLSHHLNAAGPMRDGRYQSGPFAGQTQGQAYESARQNYAGMSPEERQPWQSKRFSQDVRSPEEIADRGYQEPGNTPGAAAGTGGAGGGATGGAGSFKANVTFNPGSIDDPIPQRLGPGPATGEAQAAPKLTGTQVLGGVSSPGGGVTPSAPSTPFASPTQQNPITPGSAPTPSTPLPSLSKPFVSKPKPASPDEEDDEEKRRAASSYSCTPSMTPQPMIPRMAGT